MADRRAAARCSRRSMHQSMRRKGIITQAYLSTQQGDGGSNKPQAPQRAQKARRA